MVCKNCGIANSDASRFCSECGSVLPKPKVQEPSEQSQQAEYSAPAPQLPVFGGMPNMVPPLPPFSYVPPMMPIAPPNVVPPSVPFAPTVVPASPAEVKTDAAPAAVPESTTQPAPEVPPAQPVTAPSNPAPVGAPIPNAPGYTPAPIMSSTQPSPYMPMQYPPAYAPFGYPPLMKDPNAAKATWALWLGILSAVLPIVTCSYASPLALVMGIVAICLGAVNAKKVFPQNHSKIVAGIVVGSIGVAFSLFGCGVLVKAISVLTSSNEFKQFSEQFQSFIAFNILRVMRFTSVAVKAVVVQVQAIIRILFLK